MKKVKGIENQPNDFISVHGWINRMPVVVNYISKIGLFMDEKGKTYLKEEVEWLDEGSVDDVVFTIEEVRECWDTARINFEDGSFAWDFEEHMKMKYNIDINKS